jgi:hypothetical protein
MPGKASLSVGEKEGADLLDAAAFFGGLMSAALDQPTLKAFAGRSDGFASIPRQDADAGGNLATCCDQAEPLRHADDLTIRTGGDVYFAKQLGDVACLLLQINHRRHDQLEIFARCDTKMLLCLR